MSFTTWFLTFVGSSLPEAELTFDIGYCDRLVDLPRCLPCYEKCLEEACYVITLNCLLLTVGPTLNVDRISNTQVTSLLKVTIIDAFQSVLEQYTAQNTPI